MIASPRRRSRKSPARHNRLSFETLECRRVLATYFVDSTADNDTGTCAADNQAGNVGCTIRSATAAAAANPGNDTIRIPDGTYNTFIDFFTDVSQDFTFIGNTADPTAVVIDGGGVTRPVDIAAGTPGVNVSFQGMTFQNGVADDSSGGGGINSSGINLSLDTVIIQDNMALGDPFSPGSTSSGGGIEAFDGNVTIVDSIIRRNSASRKGGGIEFGTSNASSTINLDVTSTTIADNTSASDAGGVYLDTVLAAGRFDGVVFNNNSAGFSGGGMYAEGASVTVVDSQFTNNRSVAVGEGGGGLYILGQPGSGLFLIFDTDFRNNTADAGGGGLEIVNAAGRVDGGVFDQNQVTGPGAGFEEGGGGILVIGAPVLNPPEVTLDGVTVTGNRAPAAGGIAIVDGNVTISNALIQGNQAPSTLLGAGGIGAVSNAFGPSLVIESSRIIGNSTAAEAGGIGSVDANVRIIDSTIDGNVANGGRAGGVGVIGNARFPTLAISSTTISNNLANTDGGGIAVAAASLQMENVTVTQNTALGTGGGIAYDNTDGSAASFIRSSTVADNSGLAGAGNLAAQGTRTIAVDTSIFSAGTCAIVPGAVASQGFNIDSGSSCGFASVGDSSNTDPLLGPLQDNGGLVFTLALLAGSPAIDAANPGAVPPPTDARGATRPLDGNNDLIAVADIGAFEAEQPASLVVDEVSDVDDGIITVGNLSLREAIRLANTSPNADTITFDNAVFATAQTITLGGTQLFLAEDVTITGPGDSLLTISGNNATRIFEIASSSNRTRVVTLSGMTLADGKAIGGNGGAILGNGALTILDSTISGNTATNVGATGYGGGISGGQLTLIRSTVTGNTAENDGGGIESSGPLTVIDSTISGNTALSFGGGIALFSGPADFTNSTIQGNDAGNAGGGIFNSGGTISLAGTTVSGNTAVDSGGGLFNYSGGTLNVTNSTISGNATDGVGGGISNIDTGSNTADAVVVTNSTIVGNRSDANGNASGSGGGIYTENNPNAVTRIFNSIVAGNVRGLIGSDVDDDIANKPVDAISSDNLVGDPGSAGGLVNGGNGNIVGDGVGGTIPLATIVNPALADNGGLTLTHLLAAGSAAIDAADLGRAPTVDQRGAIRPVDGDSNGSLLPDIGSVEADGAVVPLVELFLSARDRNDVPIVVDAFGEINVAVGQVFSLELGFLDLRTPPDLDGVSKFVTDIVTSLPGVLAPAVTSTQFISFSDNLAAEAAGTITFSLEGNAVTPVVVNITDYEADPQSTLDGALAQLFPTGGVISSTLTGPGTGVLIQSVRFDADQYVLINQPKISAVVAGTAAAVTSTTRVINPMVGGLINPDAVLYIVNTDSRNSRTSFFGDSNTGSFDTDSGFQTIGGRPTDASGSPSAVSIPVVVTAAVQDLIVTLIPSLNASNGGLGSGPTGPDNPALQFDVNGDMKVTVLDAVIIIDSLGPAGSPPGIGATSLDVNSDGFVTVIDALMVINELQRRRTANTQDAVTFLDDDGDFLLVGLVNPLALSQFLTDADAQITINAAPLTQPQLTVTNVAIDEANGVATVHVTLDADVAGGFTVDYTTVDDVAVQGSDYTLTAGTLSFAGNSGEQQSFNIPINDDVVAELDERLQVVLSNPSNASVDVSDTAIVTILDDDSATLSTSMPIANEDSGAIVYTVTLSGVVDVPFTVDVATMDIPGDATAGIDYTAKGQTLTFAGNDGETQTFTVSITPDAVVELDESFAIEALNIQAGARDVRFDRTADRVDITALGQFSPAGIFAGAVELSFPTGMAYVADDSGLLVLDVTDPSSIVQLGAFATTSPVNDVQVMGTIAYVAAGSDGLLVLDVADPTNIQLLGSFATSGRITISLESSGSTIYVSEGTGTLGAGMRILDASDPTDIMDLGFFQASTSVIEDIVVEGTTAYLASSLDLLRVLDVSDPSAIVQLGSFDAGEAFTIEIGDAVAYVGTFDGLRILDVNNPASISQLGFLPTVGDVTDVDVDDEAANSTVVSIVDTSGLLQVLDASDPANLRLLGSVSGLTLPLGLVIEDRIAFIADGSGGLRAFNGDLVNVSTAGIINDDFATLTVSDVTVNENAGTASVTVTLDKAVTDGFTYDFTTVDGTATQPGDYTTTTGTLSSGTAGATQTITIPIVSDQTIEGTESFTVSLSNVVPLGSALATAIDVSDIGTVTITETPVVDLSIVKTDSVDPVIAGEALTYTLVVTNSGPSPATNVSVVDTLPTGVSFQSGDVDGNASGVSFDVGTVFANVGNLAVGASSTITIVVGVGSLTTGILSNTASVSANEVDSNLADNTATETTTIQVINNVDLRTSITDNPDPVDTSAAASFTVSIFNNGPDIANSVVSTTVLPAEFSNVSATSSFGIVTVVGNVVTLTIAELDNGTTETVTILATAPDAPGVFATGTAVTSSNDETAPADNGATEMTTVNLFVPPTVDLLVQTDTDNAYPLPGGTAFDSFTITNLTTTDATGVSIVIALDPNVTFVSSSSTSDLVFSQNGNQLTATIASLPSGTSQFVDVEVTVADGTAPSTLLTTTLTATAIEIESNPSNNSADSVNSVLAVHTLSTGSGDGDVTITVDPYGTFGSNAFSATRLNAIYDPIGPIQQASTVFRSALAFRESTTGTRTFLDRIPTNQLRVTSIAGDLTTATSTFQLDSFDVQVVQTVVPNFDNSGIRAGARLEQTYTFTSTALATIPLDLVRYLDADLDFDQSLLDGGGRLSDPTGQILLFETDAGGTGATDTTFIGITAEGGNALTTGRFVVDDFDALSDKVVSGTPLTETVTSDFDNDGFVDAGQEYDVALALRHVLSLDPGQSAQYKSTTFFGARPDSILPPPPTIVQGHISCDANGDGMENLGEAVVGAVVFLDANGNRILDGNEISTTTDANGDYQFLDVVDSLLTVVTSVPTGCNTIPETPSVIRSAISVGDLARSITSVDIDQDGDRDLVVASDLSESLSVLINEGGNFTAAPDISLGDRPQTVFAYEAAGQQPVIAVAGIGTPRDGGAVYLLEGGEPIRLTIGNGPIEVVIDDFDGNGQPDILTAALRSSDLNLMMNGSTEIEVIESARLVRAVDTGDFNGDGNRDIVLGGFGYPEDETAELKVLLGDGLGGFDDSIQDETLQRLVALVAANIDLDAATNPIDEILALSETGKLFVLSVNGGSLDLMNEVDVSPGANSLAVGDFNRDGMVDVAVSNLGNQSIEIYVGAGNGDFFLLTTIDNVAAPSDIVVDDFDLDGFKDEIAVSNFYSDANLGRSETPNFQLPSTVTLLQLDVAESSFRITDGTDVTVDFTFSAANPELLMDVSGDGSVTALDALMVINSMQLASIAEGESPGSVARNDMDVNGDGRVSALDALQIVNHLARKQLSEVDQIAGIEQIADFGHDDDDDRIAAVDLVLTHLLS